MGVFARLRSSTFSLRSCFGDGPLEVWCSWRSAQLVLSWVIAEEYPSGAKGRSGHVLASEFSLTFSLLSSSGSCFPGVPASVGRSADLILSRVWSRGCGPEWWAIVRSNRAGLEGRVETSNTSHSQRSRTLLCSCSRPSAVA